MKNKLLVIRVLLLLCIAPAAQAGFLVKKTPVISGCAAMCAAKNATTVAGKEKHIGLFAKLNNRLGILHPYEFRKKNEWVGIAAIGCGIIGLIVPGVNFLAILFGVLGMGRGCKVQGLAVAGFIMGVLELLLFLLIQTVFISLILL